MSKPVIAHLLSALTEGGTDILGKTPFSYLVRRIFSSVSH
jgi:hypothetical protein